MNFHLPDATNCRRYHICEGPARTSYIMDCPVSSNTYYYNQRTRRCDRSSLSCVPANCQSNSVFVLLGANSLYYALCSPSIVNGVTVRNPTLVLKCPGELKKKSYKNFKNNFVNLQRAVCIQQQKTAVYTGVWVRVTTSNRTTSINTMNATIATIFWWVIL
jgi:hypothetical protein